MRKVLLWVVPFVVLLVGLDLFGRGGTLATTDSAYVKQDRVSVTALVSANVRNVRGRPAGRVAPTAPAVD